MMKNLVLLALGIALGVCLGAIPTYFATVGAFKVQQPILALAIEKSTSKIDNHFINEFGKIKGKKSSSTIIKIDPSAVSQISPDSIQSKSTESKRWKLFKTRKLR